MGGSGAAAGVLAGGILTQYLGWEWIFFVNVPVGVAVLALTRSVVHESRIEGLSGSTRRAVTVTGGLALLDLRGLEGARRRLGHRPHDRAARGVGRAAARLHRDRAPRRVTPRCRSHIFRVRTVTGANVSGVLLGAVVFANFFLLTLYVQQRARLLRGEDGVDVPRHGRHGVSWPGCRRH